MTREEKIMARMNEHYEFLKTKFDEDRIVGLFLQGSQNYGLDYEGSDIDTKAIILPTLEDLILGKSMYSTTLLMENDEHVDTKDIRLMFNTIKKQNINFVEILFTDFKIINPKYEDMLRPIFDNAEAIVRANIPLSVNCLVGMAHEKHKALKHPYPATIAKIEKFGYDPKQLHHILRMQFFMDNFLSGKPYKECLINDKDTTSMLLGIKKGILSLEDAEMLADVTLTILKEDKIDYLNGSECNRDIDTEALKVLDDVAVNILMNYIKS